MTSFVDVEPALGQTWRSRDRRDFRRNVKVVGVTSTHILVRGVSVRRVRRDVFPRVYVFIREGSLAEGEEVSVVDYGGNPHGVCVGQRWQAVGMRHGTRVVIVLEVNEDEGYALAKSEEGARTTRIRLDRFQPNSTGYVLLETTTKKEKS